MARIHSVRLLERTRETRPFKSFVCMCLCGVELGKILLLAVGATISHRGKPNFGEQRCMHRGASKSDELAVFA